MSNGQSELVGQLIVEESRELCSLISMLIYFQAGVVLILNIQIFLAAQLSLLALSELAAGNLDLLLDIVGYLSEELFALHSKPPTRLVWQQQQHKQKSNPHTCADAVCKAALCSTTTFDKHGDDEFGCNDLMAT